MKVYDCIVIGAGPAGLSASLFLARYRRRVLTFHHNTPRNLYSHGVHGFLGHHGILPMELLTRGRQEVILHGGVIIEACVTNAKKLDDSDFLVSVNDTSEGSTSFRARRLLLATGLKDLTPDCPGFRDFYGASVFHCPDCDGFEVSDKHIAVLSCGESSVAYTLSLLTWTDKLTLITEDESGLPDKDMAKLRQHNIVVINQRIATLEGDIHTKELRLVRFTDNSTLTCDALFFNLGSVPASNLHEGLGCKPSGDGGLVSVDAEQQTSVCGVYAAGDITPHSQLAVVAAAEGAMAAIHIHKSLSSITY